MKRTEILLRTLLCLVTLNFTACSSSNSSIPPAAPSSELQMDDSGVAGLYPYQIGFPKFETTVEEMKRNVAETLATADQTLKSMAAQKSEKATFENLIRAIDDTLYPVSTLANRIYLIQNASTSEEMRNAASDLSDILKNWFTALDYREDLYAAVKSFRDLHPQLKTERSDLKSEDFRYYDEIWRSYKRAGLTLAPDARKEVEDLRQQLDKLTTQFDNNIRDAKVLVEFTKDELDGVPEDFVSHLEKNGDKFVVKDHVTSQFLRVATTAKLESTRKKITIARFGLAQASNTSVLEQMIALRDRIGKKLGYPQWASYRTEPKMVKTPENAVEFLTALSKNLEPKFKSEVTEMLAIKSKQTGATETEFKIWDYYYLMDQVAKLQHDVDLESLRVYFPANQVIEGLFKTYSSLFRLKFVELTPPYKWIDDLKAFLVQDAKTLEPMGIIYMDLYPRDGKYNHFAEFSLIDGKLLANGKYQRPVAALICNFPAPEDGKPSLLSHDDVVTFFHEFGHAMHSVLTQARYSRFAGTSTQEDFVEAPSQMLENWPWQKEVLDTFAADYRDPAKKIDMDVLSRMKEAKLATYATYYRRQLALATTDMTLHLEGEKKDSAAVTQKIFGQIFTATPDGTNFSAGWTHLSSYDAGYYGYAWSDVISSDLFSAFASNPRGIMDPIMGMKLRKEIYSVGGSRDANDSVEGFLGRPYNQKAFLADFGIKL